MSAPHARLRTPLRSLSARQRVVRFQGPRREALHGEERRVVAAEERVAGQRVEVQLLVQGVVLELNHQTVGLLALRFPLFCRLTSSESKDGEDSRLYVTLCQLYINCI